MTSRSSTTTKGDREARHRQVHNPPGGFALPPVHPGQTLAAELQAREMSAHALALKVRVPANRISAIVAGERGISAETALRLGRYFGTGPALWMNLQSQYDLAVAERDIGEKVAAEVEEAV
ncbi:MAG: HigA family addiction module antidote protein [Bauldia sp.]|nr:HigA family addiction module antidote protein [Bauldia sp.]